MSCGQKTCRKYSTRRSWMNHLFVQDPEEDPSIEEEKRP